MGARLISLFGTGDYDEVRYQLGAWHNERATALMPAAIVDLYRQRAADGGDEITSVVLIGTDEAKQHFDSHFSVEGGDLHRAFSGRIAFDLVKTGERDEDQRQVFTTLVDWLQRNAIIRPELQFAENEPPSEIVLDITHGFRAQGLIAGGAVTFVLSESLRARNIQPGSIRILYGRHEKGAGKDIPGYRAPVWDLTDYISATLWTLAIQAVRYGRADAADLLARQEAHSQKSALMDRGKEGRELAPADYPRRLGAALRDFADDLAFMRGKGIVASSAPKLAGVLAHPQRQSLEERIPALRGLLDEIERDARLVTSASSNLLDSEGLRASLALAELYGRLERFAEQAGTLREAFVTNYGIHHWNGEAVEPDCKGASDARAGLERTIPSWRDLESESGHGFLAMLQSLDKAREVRNDMLHLGINDQPRNPKTLKKELDRLISDLRSMTVPRPARSPEESDSGTS